MNVAEVFTDGGARGNPGLAACAFVVIKNGDLLHKESKSLGITTNNVAEYNGVLLAADWLLKNKIGDDLHIKFFLDSELVVKQINGLYKIKDTKLIPLHTKLTEKLIGLKTGYTFTHIPRSLNKLADEMVNMEMDRALK